MVLSPLSETGPQLTGRVLFQCPSSALCFLFFLFWSLFHLSNYLMISEKYIRKQNWETKSKQGIISQHSDVDELTSMGNHSDNFQCNMVNALGSCGTGGPIPHRKEGFSS